MPAGTLKEMPATAVAAGYTLMRSRTSRMGVLTMGWGVGLAAGQARDPKLPREIALDVRPWRPRWPDGLPAQPARPVAVAALTCTIDAYE
jgi:hypothetical protein